MSRTRHDRHRTNRASTFEPLERRQLMSGGTMDSTFGDGGKLFTDFGFAAKDVAVQQDGKIVLVGALDGDFAVARLNINGTVDKTFGHGTGLVTTDLAGEKFDVAEKVAIQTDGKIVVAGRKMKSNSNGQYAVVRYNPDGRLDMNFNGDGKATDNRMDISALGGLAIQSDGRIVFAGAHYQTHLNFTNPGYHYDLRTVRLMPNGALDKSFGDRVPRSSMATGSIENDFDGQDQPSAIAIQSDGKIVVAGQRYMDGRYDFIFARYKTNGTTDGSFDGDGKLSTRVTLKGTQLTGMAIQGDGKIIAVGETRGEANSQIALVRVNTDGKVDATFGNQGVVFTNLSNGDETARSVFALPTGKIVVVGTEPGAPVAVQYLSNGDRDASFGNNGVAAVFNILIAVTSAARMVDGRIVIAGASAADQSGLARLINAPVQVGIYPWVEGATESANSPKNGAIIVAREAVYNFPTRVWFTIGGNATPMADYGGDFAFIPGSPSLGYVDIPAHQSFVLVPITTVNNNALEPTEVATFTLREDAAYSGGKSIFASVTIADDDALNVNFQGPTLGTVGDYRPDRGGVFTDHFGVSYGWDTDNTANARNRGNRRSPDFRYDSLNHMQRGGANRKWEIAVPNGLYLVTLVAGDPDNTDSVYKMNLEGKLALSGKPVGDTRWFMSALNVQVNDGRLTLTNAAGAQNNRVRYIKIQAADPGATAGAVNLNVPIRLANPPPPPRIMARSFAPNSRALFPDARMADAILP